MMVSNASAMKKNNTYSQAAFLSPEKIATLISWSNDDGVVVSRLHSHYQILLLVDFGYFFALVKDQT
jgi:hypothetical protein